MTNTFKMGVAIIACALLTPSPTTFAQKHGGGEGGGAPPQNAPLSISFSAEPAHPIVGEPVVWKVIASGGDGTYNFTWNGNYEEFPWLYESPLYSGGSLTNVYKKSGGKSLTVTVSSGRDWVERTLSLEVYDSRITVLAPNGNEVWEVGKTYEIRWKTEGISEQVQIGLWDFRYNTEVGSEGGELITFSTLNTGSFSYTVPSPRANGISRGNLGGRNYRVSVGGWNKSMDDMSENPFTIVVPPELQTKLIYWQRVNPTHIQIGVERAVPQTKYELEGSVDLREWKSVHTVTAPVESFVSSFDIENTPSQFFRLRRVGP